MPDLVEIIGQFVNYHHLGEVLFNPVVLSLGSFALVAAGLFGVSWVVALPLRRRERGRVLIHLMEVSLKTGVPLERVIGAAARGGEPFSKHFSPLADAMARGQRLDEALRGSPKLAGPALAAMLQVGFELGDARPVLPACRRLLNDGVSHGRAGLNYTMFMTPLTLPFSFVLILLTLSVFVIPKLRQIVSEMESATPTLLLLVDSGTPLILWGSVIVTGLILFCAVLQLGGRWLAVVFPLLDRLFYRLPWHRRRMQRDFSAMLALLLDGGVPEKHALMLAGNCAGNRLFSRRVTKAVEKLEAGTVLADALRWLDRSGEFQWRFANAARSSSGFTALLAGWQEALDAKAFQQEQAVAQLLTTGFVLAQGAVVGLVTIGIFSALVGIIEAGVLW